MNFFRCEVRPQSSRSTCEVEKLTTKDEGSNKVI